MDSSSDTQQPQQAESWKPDVERSAPEDLASRAWLFRAGLILLTVLTFGRVVGFRFVNVDDNVNVFDNQYLRPATIENVLHFWKSPYVYMYIPVTYTFLAAVSVPARREGVANPFERFDARYFHAADLLLHLGAVLLVFELLRRLTRSNVAACLGAAVFAVHPLQVESVAWVTETKTLTAGVFSLASLLLYVKFCESGGSRWGAYTWASVAFVAALLSKPTAAAVPLMAGILAVGFYGRNVSLGKTAATLAPWVLAVGVVAYVSKTLQPDVAVGLVVPLHYRPWIALDALSFYISKLAWPLEMALDYGRNPVYVLVKRWNYFFWLLPVQLAVVLWLVGVKREWYVAALLFAAALLPVLGFVPFGYQQYSTVADRYAYLALLGAALAAALLVVQLPGRATKGAVGAVVLVLAGLSFVQAGYWRDSESLLTRTLAVNPRSELALLNLSMENLSQGKLDEAQQRITRILEQNPDSPKALHDLAIVYMLRNQLDKAREQVQRSLTLAPEDVEAINTLASILVRQNKPTEAIAKLQEALTLDPKRAMTLGNLGQAYASSGQIEKAADYYELALKYEPDVPNFHFGLALTQMALGRREEALLQLQEAARLDPSSPDVQLRLGLLLHSLNQLAPASAAYRRALELKPDWWEPQANLAVLLSMNPDPAGRDPKEAVRLAEAAVASTKRKSADAMDALAAATLVAGDPVKALEIEQEALTLAQAEKNSDKILRIQERLNLIRTAQQRFRRTPSDDRGP